MNGIVSSVVVVVDEVVVVLVVDTHDPAVVGFETLKSSAPLFVTLPLANWMLYESPPPIVSRTQASEPGSGGTTSTAPSLASMATLIWKTPFLTLIRALFTGPLAPFESLYL